ncbi:MAG: hypothetical protein RR714_04140, partial [Aurantimicrobium sp.]
TFSEWTVEIEFSAANPVSEGTTFDLLEGLASYHAIPAVEDAHGTITATVDARTYSEATSKLPELIAAITKITGPTEIEAVNLMSANKFHQELDHPLIPEVAALGEIAELAGVTRQRANSLVKNKTFPAPITELKAGKLWLKPAVENWLQNWTRKPGAPKKEIAAHA